LITLSSEITKELCGGSFPTGSDFDWNQVHHFELDHGTIQPMDGFNHYLPGPSLSVVVLEDPLRFVRASCDCVCSECGKSYLSHPEYEKELSWQGKPYLHKLCNGLLVKL
jgi:hypothetical protein